MSDIEEMKKLVRELGVPDDLPEVALGDQSVPDPDALARIKARTLHMAGGQVTPRSEAVVRPSRFKKAAWWIGAAAVAAGLLAFALLGSQGKSPIPPIQPASPGAKEPGPGQPAPVSPDMIPAPQTLTALSFLDDQTGWVTGFSGERITDQKQQLLATADGGKTWASLTAPGGQALQLKFIDASHGWAVAQVNPSDRGYQGVAIFATTDGGKSWSKQWEESQSLNSLVATTRTRIAFFGPQNGLVQVGGNLLRTQDGGSTWTKITLPDGYVADDISFVDAQHGWTATELGRKANQMDATGPVLFATADGGQTWQKSFDAGAALGNKFMYWGGTAGLAFTDTKNGWLFFKDGGWQAYLYRTTDGGATWQQQTKDVASGRTVAGVPVFVGSTGWLPVAHGAAPIAGGLWITRDAGEHWSMVGGNDRFGSVGNVSLVSPTVGWALGIETQEHDFLVKTTDGGQTWTQVLPALGPNGAISLTAGGKGMGIGTPADANAILATTDGGATWTQTSRLESRPVAVAADAQGNGWVVTGTPDHWAIMKTADGGRSFTTLAEIPVGGPGNPLTPTVPYFRMFDEKNGLLQTGDFPSTILLATTDGGVTWQQQFSIQRPPASWTNFSFVSPTTGLLALQSLNQSTAGLSIMQTGDGGKNWTTVKEFGTDTWLQGMAFISPEQGWMVVRKNPLAKVPEEQLLRTSDGGKTWETQSIMGPAAQVLLNGAPEYTRIFFLDASYGWIVNPQGRLYTSDSGKSWTKR
jgi:photosystem II stability/assembly factor-like uncharacterized protein